MRFSPTFVAVGASAQSAFTRLPTLTTTRAIAVALQPVAGSCRYSPLILAALEELIRAANGIFGKFGLIVNSREISNHGRNKLCGGRFSWQSVRTAACLGVEALAIEKAVLKVDPNSQSTWREMVPPDWAPWSMLAGGAVVMLYSFTIPQRVGGGG